MRLRNEQTHMFTCAATALVTLASSYAWASDPSTAPTNVTSPPLPTSPAVLNSTLPDDLRLLVGRRVNVGRLLLCVPRSYTPKLSYSGKDATVIAFTKNRQLDSVKATLAFMPANVRPMMDDLLKGGTLEFQFDDGTKLDSCADLGFAAISAQLEIAAGDTVIVPSDSHAGLSVAQPSAVETKSPPLNSPTQCPITITKLSSGNSFSHMLADALTTSEFQRQVDLTLHNGTDKHYLDVQTRNDSGQLVSAFEFNAVYLNAMGDESVSTAYVSRNAHPIKPGESFKTFAMDRSQLSLNGVGKVKLYISRVRFEDGSLWTDDGTRSCSRVGDAH